MMKRLSLLLLCASAWATNTYVSDGVAHSDSTGVQATEIWHAANSSAGEVQVTATFSGSTTAAMCVAEFFNVATSNPVDAAGVGVSNGASTTLPTSATVTTANATDLVVVGINANVTGLHAGSTFTDLGTNVGNGCAYRTTTGTGTFSTQWDGTLDTYSSSGSSYKSSGGTPTLVQTSGMVDCGVAATTCAVTINPTGSGNLIVVFVDVNSTTVTVSSIADAPPAQRTVCIDFVGGSDSNSGLPGANGKCSGGTPNALKHHPFMCGYTGSLTHQATDQYIFKGGVVWDGSNFNCANEMNITAGGIAGAGNSDLYGVDTLWFAGGSFTKPIWDGCLPGATFAACTASTASSNFDHTQAVSIMYVIASNVNYVTIKGIEMRHVYCPIAAQTYGGCSLGYLQGPNHDIDINGNNIHGWFVQQVAIGVSTPCGSNVNLCDDKYGGTQSNNQVACSSGIACYDNSLFRFNHVHNEDGGILNSAGTLIQYIGGTGYAASGIQKYRNNEIDHVSNFFLGGGEEVSYTFLHDVYSQTGDFSAVTIGNNTSTNAGYVGFWQGGPNDMTRPCYFHHNFGLHVHASAAQAYITPTNAHTTVISCYVYDNVSVDGASSGAVYFDPYQTWTGSYLGIAFYNTIETPISGGTQCYVVGPRNSAPGDCQVGHAPCNMSQLTFRGNQCITDSGLGISFSANSVTPTDTGQRDGTGAWNYLETTHSNAQSQGYASTQWAPINSSAQGVGKVNSANITCSACPDFGKAFDPAINQATYFASHSNTFALVNRPASGNVDVGAYYIGASGTLPGGTVLKGVTIK